MDRPTVARTIPYSVNVEAGRTYLWCACGRSRSQPFCDSSHLGTGFEPKPFRAPRSGTVYFCGCKHTRTPPVCDSSHIDLARKG